MVDSIDPVTQALPFILPGNVFPHHHGQAHSHAKPQTINLVLHQVAQLHAFPCPVLQQHCHWRYHRHTHHRSQLQTFLQTVGCQSCEILGFRTIGVTRLWRTHLSLQLYCRKFVIAKEQTVRICEQNKLYAEYSKIKQNYKLGQVKQGQGMNGLESEKNPLRLSKQFYQPQQPRASQASRKNYPALYGLKSPILDVPEPMSIVTYVGEIQKIKPIHREFGHVEMYYPDKVKNMKRRDNMYSTVTTRRKSMSSFLKPIHHRSIQEERDEFLRTFRAKSSAKEETNLSFHNTARKSKYIMDKFCDDAHINERSSPTFQNMLNRTIVIEDVLEKTHRNQRKFVKGF